MNTLMVLLNIGGQEILIILLIVLVLFGGRKIPELMKGLGKGVREYKKVVNGAEDEVDAVKNAEPTNTADTKENNLCRLPIIPSGDILRFSGG